MSYRQLLNTGRLPLAETNHRRNRHPTDWRVGTTPIALPEAPPQSLVLQSATSGKLHSHLADVEEQAQELFNHLTTDLATKEGITEQLKATNQMKWLQRMNNIRERVVETVYSDVVFV